MWTYGVARERFAIASNVTFRPPPGIHASLALVLTSFD
jgi:hypothetical protein